MGFEILGSTNQEKDDEEILNSAINVINKLNLKSTEVVIGNVNIFKEFLYKIKKTTQAMGFFIITGLQ